MSARTRESTGVVADAVLAMYAAYGDPVRFDEHLHRDITIWESDQPGPMLRLAQLDRLRDRRDTSGAPRPQLLVEDLLVDRWSQVAAVARYVLRAREEGGDTTFRVTDVWDLAESRPRIVHHHAELVAPGGAPVRGEGAPDAG
jgi:hypothetical protein